MMLTIKQAAVHIKNQGGKRSVSSLKKDCQDGFLETAEKRNSARGEYWIVDKKEIDRKFLKGL